MSESPSRLSRQYRIPADVLSRQVKDETVLLHLGSEEYFGLDPVGTRMWMVLQESGDPTVVIERMLDEFEVDKDTLSTDLDLLLDELEKSGLIVPVDEASAGSPAGEKSEAGAEAPPVPAPE